MPPCSVWACAGLSTCVTCTNFAVAPAHASFCLRRRDDSWRLLADMGGCQGAIRRSVPFGRWSPRPTRCLRAFNRELLRDDAANRTVDRTRPDTPSYHCKSTARGVGTPAARRADAPGPRRCRLATLDYHGLPGRRNAVGTLCTTATRISCTKYKPRSPSSDRPLGTLVELQSTTASRPIWLHAAHIASAS